MPSLLTKSAVMVLVGAAVNVAVAWGLAMWSPRSGMRYNSAPLGQSDLAWLTQYHEDFDDHEITVRRLETFGRREVNVSLQQLPSSPQFPQMKPNRQVVVTCWREQCGWPLLCFDAQYPVGWGAYGEFTWNRRPIAGDNLSYDPARGLVYINNRWLGRPRWLPAQPNWWGIAINTIFYAAACWGTGALVISLRRRWRTSRRLCPVCAYPIGTHDLCTECGHTLARSMDNIATAQS